MNDKIGIEDLKKEEVTKVALTITVKKNNLDYIKNDMKAHNVELSMSRVFDYLLGSFVKNLKQLNDLQKTNEEKKKNDAKKVDNKEDKNGSDTNEETKKL